MWVFGLIVGSISVLFRVKLSVSRSLDRLRGVLEGGRFWRLLGVGIFGEIFLGVFGGKFLEFFRGFLGIF